MGKFTRYHIPTELAPNLRVHPPRFKVHVRKSGLAKTLIKEFIHYRGNLDLVLSRPCMYGVFSGPIGGFSPRSHKCVGCLRCTIEHPDFVQVEPNLDRSKLGDSYYTPEIVDTLLYEATSGRIPVRGAGYRGGFGGAGWDGMWLDMSEIVRPTRDGIHGREFISTSVDIGTVPTFLQFNHQGELIGEKPDVLSLPIPMLLDRQAKSVETANLYSVLVQSASKLMTLAYVPIRFVTELPRNHASIVPLVSPDEIGLLDQLDPPTMIELEGWSLEVFKLLRDRFPNCKVSLRVPFGQPLEPYLDSGIRIFHLMANYHGRAGDKFILGAIRETHEWLVSKRVREQVSLIGSGGIALAEHLPKAIVSGLDAVALNAPILLALQGELHGEATSQENAQVSIPATPSDWAIQRVVNLLGAWNDQLLEVMGAMGLREVRRLRGELGRAMFQEQMEQEAFSGIEGFIPSRSNDSAMAGE